MPSFSFLNASFLYYLPLLGLPVLIHLISRKKRKLIDFPSLKFLKTAYMKRVKYIKLNEMLLLIVRMLIAAFLILAFSRFCAFMPDPSPATGLKYAVVIDDSYSLQYASGGGKMIDRLKKEAAEFIMKFKHSPEFMLIRTSARSIGPGFLSQEAAAAEINSLKVSAVPRSLANTMAALVKSERYKEFAAVFVFSDFIAADPGDAAKLSALLAADQAIRQGPRAELFNIGPADAAELSKNKNLSIFSVTLPEEKIIAGKDFQMKGIVKNHSIYPATAEIGLWQDESLIDQIQVKVDPRADAEFAIRHSFANFGQHSMRLSLQPDAVSEDNDFNFILNPISSLYVMILYRDNEKKAETGDFKFVSTALNPLNSISLKDGLIIQPVLVNTAFQAPADFKNYDAVIVSGLDALDESVAARLEKFVSDGGGVLILPPQDINHRNFSRSFAKISPVIFNETVSPIAAPNETSFFSFTDIAYDHPVFSLFKNKASGDIEKPKFFRIIPVDEKSVAAPGSSSVIAKFEHSVPALVERRVGKGISIIFTGFLDSVNSNISASPLFVPFIHQMIHYINKNRLSDRRPFVINDTITEVFQASDRVTSVVVHTPGESREQKLDIKNSPEGLSASFTATSIPGIYTIFKKTEDRIETIKYAVNRDPRESFIDRSDHQDISNAFNGAGILKPGAAGETIFSEKRIDITPYLFLIVLLLMAAENFIMLKQNE